MRRLLASILASMFFLLLVFSFSNIHPGYYTADRYNYYNPIEESYSNGSIPSHYISNTRNETGAINAVTAIVVEYRGFDTLGEVTVLFAAATGVSFILYEVREKKKRIRGNLILREGSKLVFPFILLTGVYIFIHGHLTPGGGFPGGAVIASGFLLMMLSYPKFFIKKRNVTLVESLAGLTFAFIGLLGLVFASSFLQNFLPLGDVGYLFSSGIIPPIYIAIGFKVGSELGSIANKFKEVQS